MNLYGYVANNPLSRRDLFGLAYGLGHYTSQVTPSEPGPAGAFAKSLLDSYTSILAGFAWMLTGNEEARDTAAELGPLGQTEDADPFTKYSTRLCLAGSATAATAALGTGLWGAAGLPTFTMAGISSPNLHFFYGVTEGGVTTWMHAAGAAGAMATSESQGLAGFAGALNTVSGWPIISPAAAAAVGVPAYNCFTGMCSAFLRGWIP